MKGKTAIVTGSTSGIGLAIATALARHGVNVMLNGFGDVERAKSQVAAAGYEVDYHGADLTRPSDIELLIDQCRSRFGNIDILVNNAGIQHVAPVEEFPVQRWDAILAVNLSAAFHTTRLVLPGMRQQGWGRIINIASVHGLVASIHKSAYVAAKHGLIGLTKSIALETATSGVTVNAICPGWVLTPLVQRQIDAKSESNQWNNEESIRALLAEKQPSLQFVSPEQIADLVVYLCSPSADNIRGASLSIDGGWAAQ